MSETQPKQVIEPTLTDILSGNLTNSEGKIVSRAEWLKEVKAYPSDAEFEKVGLVENEQLAVAKYRREAEADLYDISAVENGDAVTLNLDDENGKDHMYACIYDYLRRHRALTRIYTVASTKGEGMSLEERREYNEWIARQANSQREFIQQSNRRE